MSLQEDPSYRAIGVEQIQATLKIGRWLQQSQDLESNPTDQRTAIEAALEEFPGNETLLMAAAEAAMKQRESQTAITILKQLHTNHPTNRAKILLISAYLRRSRKIEMKYSAINDNPVRWQRKAKYEEIEIAARKPPDSKLGISIKLVKPAWPLNALSSIIIATVDPL